MGTAMVVNIFFAVLGYPVLLVMYFVMRGAGEVQNGYCCGASVQRGWAAKEEITQIVGDYRKELKRVLLVMAVMPLFTFVIPFYSVNITIWMIWIFAVIAATQVPYVRGNIKIKELKRQWGAGEQRSSEVLTEMKNAGKVRRVKPLSFLPPIIISFGAAIWGVWCFRGEEMTGFCGMVVTFAFLTVLFYGVAVWMDRQKINVVSSDSNVNLNYARAKKNLWKNLWLCMAWVNTAFTVAMVLFCGRAVYSGMAFGGKYPIHIGMSGGSDFRLEKEHESGCAI